MSETELKNNPKSSVHVVGKPEYYSLGSPEWTNLNASPYKSATWNYTPPGVGNFQNPEFATMNMANWGRLGAWHSATMRLNKALGFGRYEQSLKVAVGSGTITTFYLSEFKTDQQQEIDFEFSGNHPSGTKSVWTNVWWKGQQKGNMSWLGAKSGEGSPDSTQGWAKNVYRYMIDWEPDIITWSVDVTGTGNSYVTIRTQDMSNVGKYDESLCYPFISLWTSWKDGKQGWSPDASPFLEGRDAAGKEGNYADPCYQAFYFQPLKFTPSANNKLVTAVH
jgi:hypothetical protein